MAKSEYQPFFEGFEPAKAAESNAGAHSDTESIATEKSKTRRSTKRAVRPNGENAEAQAGEKKPLVPKTVEVTYSLESPEMPEDLSGQTVVIIDSHSLIYQIFHALAPMSSPAGTPVTAVFGFLRDVAELRDRWQPAFLWCAFDLSDITFRNELYPDYKVHREPMPDELRIQIPAIRESLELLGVGIADAPGFEADDVLATLALQISQAGGRCIIVTSDKDCRQLITDQVQLYNIRKQEIFDAAKLKEVWGIRPDQVVDFQSLVGDSVDNVPGVPLIGPKFAQQLLEQFDTLDHVLDNPDSVSGKKRAENLRLYRDKALLSRDLVRLRDDVPLELDWRDANFSRRNPIALNAKFNEFGFRRLGERLVGPLPELAVKAQDWPTNYVTVDTPEKLEQLAEKLNCAKIISIDTETTSANARWADLVGISLCWEAGEAAYIPVRAPTGTATLPIDTIASALQPALANANINKIGQNLKYDLIVLRQVGIRLDGIAMDTMVADYLIDPGQRDHSLDDLSRRYLQHKTIKIAELIGTGRDQLCMDQVPIELITRYACQDVDMPWRMHQMLTDLLQQHGLDELFRTVEVPLVLVLADMEYEGITIDTQRLESLRSVFAVRIAQLQGEIESLAGESFNLDSPKQLQVILYDKLKLPVLKKTQTGASTDAEVLLQLAVHHELPEKLLEYRQLAKLQSTYVDSLSQLVCPKTGRVHTSFRQDVAATGRLSSSEPNLQNIPVRTEEGRQIRSAFKAGLKEWKLLAADYSQIELRVLAHYCSDETLCEAFLQDRDIHSQVASQVYGVALEQVTASQRRSAKAINFGIIYGQSPFGLAKGLKISKSEAAQFIEDYFARFPGVRQFIEDTIMTCRAQGYVSTMLGRRRYVKGVRDYASLSESRKQVMIEPERIAVNTIIQGSAADLIKLAMLKVHQRLKESNLRAKMLLQIHDELLFEVHESDCEALSRLVAGEMSAVAQLQVPLKVDVKAGPDWAACDPM